MAVVATYAKSFIEELFQAIHDLTSDTVVVVLMNTTFVFDEENDGVWSDISTDEISAGNGYTSGGITLTGVAVAGDSPWTGVVELTCTNNPTWTASGGAIATTGAAVILQYNAGTPANSRIIMSIDFGEDYATADGKQFQVNFSNGIGKATITI